MVTIAKISVDEGVHSAKLQLDRSTHVIEPHDPRVLTNGLKKAIDLAPVIVRHFEDEQIFEYVSVIHDGIRKGNAARAKYRSILVQKPDGSVSSKSHLIDPSERTWSAW